MEGGFGATFGNFREGGLLAQVLGVAALGRRWDRWRKEVGVLGEATIEDLTSLQSGEEGRSFRWRRKDQKSFLDS